MAIDGYSEHQFGDKLGAVLSASRPIHNIEQLKGRDKELNTIKRGLYAPGRHVFIYGDRGVGKSSLGQTVAMSYQSEGPPPIFVSGSPDDNFTTIIANIISQAIGRRRTNSERISESRIFHVDGHEIRDDKEITGLDISKCLNSVGDAVELLSQIQAQPGDHRAIVIDEFDAIVDPAQRNRFSALLKQLGDRSINLKFIFTGIGKSLDDLLGAHQSAHRQLETVELPRLGWDARKDIVKAAVESFGIGLDDNVNWRIASISDGFPYYIHLITEKLLWAAFSSKETVTDIGSELFHQGLADAILSTSAELKRPYEKAVVYREPEFEDIVWATADHEDLIRKHNDIYQSYMVIVGKRKDGRMPLNRERFTSQLRRLKLPAYGQILQSEVGRQGLFSYREKMLRGYARMQAAASGMELTGERAAPKQVMRVANARTGCYGPSEPFGVRSAQNISEWDDK